MNKIKKWIEENLEPSVLAPGGILNIGTWKKGAWHTISYWGGLFLLVMLSLLVFALIATGEYIILFLLAGIIIGAVILLRRKNKGERHAKEKWI